MRHRDEYKMNITLLTTQPSKHLFNVSKITKEHKPSHLSSNIIFMTFEQIFTGWL